MNCKLEQFIHCSAPQRIGCFLLGLFPVTDQKDGLELMIPYDKQVIASTLSIKGTTFSRALNMLRDETGIQIHRNNVKRDSMKRLLKFVDGCYSQTHLYKP
jgi:hypothetical protein